MNPESLYNDSFVKASQELDHGLILYRGREIFFANNFILNLLGYSHDDLLGKPTSILINPEQKEILRGKLSTLALDSNQRFKYDAVYLRKDGSPVPVEIIKFGVSIQSTRLKAFFISDRSEIDTTNRKLYLSEHRYQKFFEKSSVPLFSTDIEGNLLTWNSAFAKLVRLDYESVNTPSLARIVSLDFEDVSKEIIKEGNVDEIQATLLNKEVEVVVRISMIYIKDTATFDGVMMDVTHQVQIQRQLRYLSVFDGLITKLSTHFIELGTEEIDAGINYALSEISEFAKVESAFILSFITDQQLKLESFVTSRDSTKSQEMSETLHRSKFPLLKDMLRKEGCLKVNDISEVKKLSPDTYRSLKSNGVKSLLLIPMLRENDIVGVLGFAYFSKTHEWSEEMISVMRVSSEMFTNALFRKNIDLQVSKLYESQSNLFSQIAHSLKTPFTVALSNLELIKNSRSEKDKDSYIEEARSSILEASSIIGQLLKVAHMDLITPTTHPKIIEVTDLADEVHRKSKALLKSHYSEIDYSEMGDFFSVEVNSKAKITGERSSLVEAILILIDNAFIHSTKPGEYPKVNVVFEELDRDIKISIIDQGKGIPEHEIDLLFDLYFQGSNTSGGSGIGLAYCRKIVEAQKGKIEITSSLGSGTVAAISLPIQKS